MVVLRKWPTPFAVSLLLHVAILLVWAFVAANSHFADRAHSSKYILVEVDPLAKSRTQDSTRHQVVQTEKGTRTKDVAPDAFLGEQTQRVDHQKVSMPKTGTAPRTAEAKPKPSKAVAEDVSRAAKKAPAILTGTGALAKLGIAIATGADPSPRPKQAPNPLEEGSLTTQARGEYVKGFREGEQTMLNTREFVFYGYFQRIRQSLDRAWEKSLREQLRKYFYRGRQLASDTDYMTQLLVSLDRNGRITKVQIIGNSGTKDLDDAATKAFNDAGPFPNPPTGLVNDQGQVYVRWDFVLKT